MCQMAYDDRDEVVTTPRAINGVLFGVASKQPERLEKVLFEPTKRARSLSCERICFAVSEGKRGNGSSSSSADVGSTEEAYSGAIKDCARRGRISWADEDTDDEDWKRARTPSPECAHGGWNRWVEPANMAQMMTFVPFYVPCSNIQWMQTPYPEASYPEESIDLQVAETCSIGEMVEERIKRTRSRKRGRTRRKSKCAQDSTNGGEHTKLELGDVDDCKTDEEFQDPDKDALAPAECDAHAEPRPRSGSDESVSTQVGTRSSLNSLGEVVDDEVISTQSHEENEYRQRCEECVEGAQRSIGSAGHPHTCAAPCKYHQKSKGCKDGLNCTHCHLCVWKPDRRNSTRRPKKRLLASDPSEEVNVLVPDDE